MNQFAFASGVRAVAIAAAVAAASFAAHADVVPWTIAGPGTTSASTVGADSTLSYNMNPAGFVQRTTGPKQSLRGHRSRTTPRSPTR